MDVKGGSRQCIFQGYDGQTMIDPRFDVVKIEVLRGCINARVCFKKWGFL